MATKVRHSWAAKQTRRAQVLNCAFRILVVVALLSCLYLAAQSDAGKRAASSNNTGEMARGKYIVEDVAMCAQCHTPRDSNGELERGKWLEGASLWLQPSRPTSDWPLKAPRIAGNPPGSDADMIKLLTTGLWQDNKPLRPPMPQFRMTQQDAAAVVAYLKSLSPTPE
jgi:mono/diheme cytochrome c family protein